MQKVVVVYGTRPEAIKLAPVVNQLRVSSRLTTVIVSTGQHTGLLTQTESALNLCPDIQLSINSPGQSLSESFATTLAKFGSLCAELKPDLVIVQGDTTTAAAAALAAFYCQIPVAHVEAGLRTGNKASPFPEELNRIIADQASTLLFAPTQTSADNLRREGITAGIHVVGNTIVDAFNSINTVKSAVLDGVPPYLVFTMHRRENFGTPMLSVCKSLLKIVDCEDIDIVIPIHPNPEVQKTITGVLGAHKRIRIVPPLGYLDFLQLVRGCKFLLSDSGGIQEEAALLHKPILILRKETERPEVLEAGIGLLIGHSTNKLETWAHTLLHDQEVYIQMSSAINPFGDGTSASRIVALVDEFLRAKLPAGTAGPTTPLPTT